MRKTVYVIYKGDGWTVARDGGKAAGIFSTQREAIRHAREIVLEEQSGQLVVYGRDGRVRERNTYGMPAIQDPPGKISLRIERAVDKITREQL